MAPPAPYEFMHKEDASDNSLEFCLLGTSLSLKDTSCIEDVESAVRDMLTASVPEHIRSIHARNNRSLTDYNHYTFYRLVREQRSDCCRVDISRIHVYHRDDPELKLSVLMALQVVYVVCYEDGGLEEVALFAREIAHGSTEYIHFGAERSTLEFDLEEHLVHVSKNLVQDDWAPRPRSQIIFVTNRRTVVIGAGTNSLTQQDVPVQEFSFGLDRRVVALAGISGQHVSHFGYLSEPYPQQQHVPQIRKPLMIQYNRQHPRWLDSAHPIADANHFLHGVTPALGERFCGLGFYLRLRAQPDCISVRICRLLCYMSQRQPAKKILSLQVVYESCFSDESILETMGPQISCYFTGFRFPPNAQSSHISVHTLELEDEDDYIVSIRTRQDEQGVNQIKVETSRGQKVAFGKRVGTKQSKHVFDDNHSPTQRDMDQTVDLITHPLHGFRVVALVGFCQNKSLVRLGATSQLLPWPTLKPWILLRHLVQLQRATLLPLHDASDDETCDNDLRAAAALPSLKSTTAVVSMPRKRESLFKRLRKNRLGHYRGTRRDGSHADQFHRIVQTLIFEMDQDVFRKILSFLAPTRAY